MGASLNPADGWITITGSKYPVMTFQRGHARVLLTTAGDSGLLMKMHVSAFGRGAETVVESTIPLTKLIEMIDVMADKLR